MIGIIGAGGHAKCVYECFNQKGLVVLGFFDDESSKVGEIVINGVEVIGVPETLKDFSSVTDIFVAIGDNRQRLLKYINYKKNGYRFPNAIHIKAYLSEFAQIGEGNFVMGTAIINPGSNIGNCCIINTNATVGHDCIFEDAVQLGPGVNIAGSCHIKQGAFIGIGAKVAPGVTIGAWSVVGAGSVVLEDVPDSVFCCGVPARVVKDKSVGRQLLEFE